MTMIIVITTENSKRERERDAYRGADICTKETMKQDNKMGQTIS